MEGEIKMNKKRIAGILLIISIMAICLCGCSNEKEKITAPEVQTTQTEKTIDDRVTDITSIVKENMTDSYYNHEYKTDDNTLYIYFKIDGLTEYIATGNISEYQSLTASLDELGEVSYRAANYEFDVCYVILNDMNENNILYMNLNGDKIYDVSEEL